jgi:hypothetical protein
MWPYHKWRASFRGVGYVCARCVRDTGDWHRAWKTPAPCVNCGRPVVHDYYRQTPKRVVCGPKCKQAVRDKPHLRLAPLHEFHCEMCGKLFLAKRSDAFYCSSLCRLRASRERRHAEASHRRPKAASSPKGDEVMARLRCPRCDTPNTDETTRGDRLDYRCRQCGEFSISTTDMEHFRRRRADPKRAQFVQRDDGRRYLVSGL